MAFTIGIIVFVVGITLSVALHELGHMLPAKAFGVRVPRYMIGFGPTLWSTTRGETEYGVKAFPLGGYVRLMGMVPPAEEVKPVRIRGWAGRVIEETRASAVEEMTPGEEHRAFYRLPWHKRIVVMAGGALTNLFLAILIFTVIGLAYGAPTETPTVHTVRECVLPAEESRECTPADPPTAAKIGGFEAGDTILAVDGIAVDGWEQLVDYIQGHPAEAVDFAVLRDGVEVVLVASPTLENRPVVGEDGEYLLDRDGEIVTAPVGFLGVQPSLEVVRQGIRYGPSLTFRYLGMVASAIWHLPEYLWDTGRAVLGYEERNPEGIMSILGAGRIAGEIAAVDDPSVGLMDQIAGMLSLVAAINLALFAFNAIPLLPLDGGHVTGAVWQGLKDGWARVRRAPKARPVDLARMMPVAYVVFALLILMGALLIYADIVVPIEF